MQDKKERKTKITIDTGLKFLIKYSLIPDELLQEFGISKQNIYEIRNNWDDSKVIGKEYGDFLRDNEALLTELLKYKYLRNSAMAVASIHRAARVIYEKSTDIKDFVIAKAKSLKVKKKVIKTIKKVRKSCKGFKLERACKLFGITKNRFYEWLREVNYRCKDSVLNKCLRRQPNQLLPKEVKIIKSMLSSKKFIGWPVSSIAAYARRHEILFVSNSTWYKYVKVLGIKLVKPKHRHKKHLIGLRALFPNQYWHADVTIITTQDGNKVFIYFVQDNYSRMILAWAVSNKMSGDIRRATLQEAYDNYILPNVPDDEISLVVDGGSENYNSSVDDFLAGSTIPIKRLLAQQDIEYSNSMIEAFNKITKYQWLYKFELYDMKAVIKKLEEFIPIFNYKRPSKVLNDLIPYEAYSGKSLDYINYSHEMKNAHKERVVSNQSRTCDCKPAIVM